MIGVRSVTVRWPYFYVQNLIASSGKCMQIRAKNFDEQLIDFVGIEQNRHLF